MMTELPPARLDVLLERARRLNDSPLAGRPVQAAEPERFAVMEDGELERASEEVHELGPDVGSATTLLFAARPYPDPQFEESLQPPRAEPRVNPNLASYDFGDFLPLSGGELVDCAYQCILRRSPDQEGREQAVFALSSGQIDKETWLFELLRSPEGTRVNVPVTGVWRRRIKRRLYRLPVLGRLARIAAGAVSLPSIRRSIEHHAHQSAKAQETLERVTADRKAIQAEFANAFATLREEAITTRAALEGYFAQLSLKAEEERAELRSMVEDQRTEMAEEVAGAGSALEAAECGLRERFETLDYAISDELSRARAEFDEARAAFSQASNDLNARFETLDYGVEDKLEKARDEFSGMLSGARRSAEKAEKEHCDIVAARDAFAKNANEVSDSLRLQVSDLVHKAKVSFLDPEGILGLTREKVAALETEIAGLRRELASAEDFSETTIQSGLRECDAKITNEISGLRSWLYLAQEKSDGKTLGRIADLKSRLASIQGKLEASLRGSEAKFAAKLVDMKAKLSAVHEQNKVSARENQARINRDLAELQSNLVGFKKEIDGAMNDSDARFKTEVSMLGEKIASSMETSINESDARHAAEISFLKSKLASLEESSELSVREAGERVGAEIEALNSAFSALKEQTAISMKERELRVTAEMKKFDAALCKFEGEVKEARLSAQTEDGFSAENFAEFYRNFEAKFRGTYEEIRNRVEVYSDTVNKALKTTSSKRFIDLGCGRGELLDFATSLGADAVGVDLLDTQLAEARRRGFEVHQQDALEYLRAQPNRSASVIGSLHMVEHIPFDTLLALLDEAARVLERDGYLILETPNPENVQVGANNFYLDPTHLRPLPPALLEFCTLNAGFRNVDVLRLAPMHDMPQFNEQEDDHEKIKRVLFGSQDYAVIATL